MLLNQFKGKLIWYKLFAFAFLKRDKEIQIWRRTLKDGMFVTLTNQLFIQPSSIHAYS